MLDEADQGYADKHGQGHAQGNRNVAGEGKAVGQQTQQVTEKNEHKEREDEREELATGGTDVVPHHARHELVTELGHRLPPPRHQSAALHGQRQEQRHHGDGRDHHESGIGKGSVEAAHLNGNNGFDLELL